MANRIKNIVDAYHLRFGRSNAVPAGRSEQRTEVALRTLPAAVRGSALVTTTFVGTL